jgi:hypothetical protein
MNVNGVSGCNQPQQTDLTSLQTHFQAAFAPVAQLFGESSDQLMSELQSGKTSLSDLAQQKGISSSDLVAAIKQGLQQTAANGGPAWSDTQLTNIANRIANHKHGHHHRPSSATTETTASVDTLANGGSSYSTSTPLAL